jgi:DNA-binding transcriptional ArsR family regulator
MFDQDERLFMALADATRRQLVITLAENSPKTATQLAEEFPITRQGIVKHLDLLAQAGLVHAQTQGREKRYWLAPEPLNRVSSWIDGVGTKWEERLQRLKTFVESDQESDEEG